MSKKKRTLNSDPEMPPDSAIPAVLTDAESSSPQTHITVMIAACGYLLSEELQRQKAAGTVEQLGQLVIAGELLKPDEMRVLPFNNEVENAIKQGWIIVMG